MLITNQLSGFGSSLRPSTGNDSYTKLLLHCEGSDVSTTFTDSSSSAISTGVGADAQVDTAQFKFGAASALFDGTGDYIYASDSDNWDFGTGDFTIDWWSRANSFGLTSAVFTQYVDANNFYEFNFNTSPYPRFKAVSGGSTLVDFAATGSPYSTGTWIHTALERHGNTWNIFKNGTSIATTTASVTMPNIASSLYIGFAFYMYGGSIYWNGWMDEFRISKGIARYGGSSFTPPTVAYS